MEIKRFHIYTFKYRKNKSSVVVIQNDHANKLCDFTIVTVYKDNKFKGIYTVKKEDLVEEIGVLSENKQEELKEYYYSVIAG